MGQIVHVSCAKWSVSPLKKQLLFWKKWYSHVAVEIAQLTRDVIESLTKWFCQFQSKCGVTKLLGTNTLDMIVKAALTLPLVVWWWFKNTKKLWMTKSSCLVVSKSVGTCDFNENNHTLFYQCGQVMILPRSSASCLIMTFYNSMYFLMTPTTTTHTRARTHAHTSPPPRMTLAIKCNLILPSVQRYYSGLAGKVDVFHSN